MNDIKKYAAMAKLTLTDAEFSKVNELCTALFDSFESFAEVNTDNVEPMFTVLRLQNAFREDIVAKNYTRDQLLAYAPAKQDGYFQVPKTI